MIIVLILSWITSLITLCLVQIGHNYQEKIYRELKEKQNDIYKAQLKTRVDLISMEESIIEAIKTNKK